MNLLGDKKLDEVFICRVCNKKFKYKRGTGTSKELCSNCRQSYRKKILKHRAILYKGGKCQICGYNKSEHSLVFHHLDPKEKEFGIAKKYNISWDRIKIELDKCLLLCANCHGEIHAQDEIPLSKFQEVIIPQEDRLKQAKIKKDESNKEKEEEILNLSKIHNVSAEIIKKDIGHYKQRRAVRPNYEQFQKEMKELNNNYSAMGRKYGVSGNTIRKWEKSYIKYAEYEK